MGDNGGCARAATSAFREFDIDEVSNAKGHGEAAVSRGTLVALLSA